MAKQSGGTRNYYRLPSVLARRKAEFDSLIAKGDYVRSHFSQSGGYYVIHKDHKPVTVPNENKENEAAKFLADKGYRVYMMGEGSYLRDFKKTDGFHEHAIMDIKTINSASKYRIERVLKNAALQNAEVVVLMQNTKDMTRNYVENQINLFKENAKGSERGNLKQVIVVGLSGRIHRHSI